jgi:uncharacterized protein YjbI with pentapeptide repeats
MLSLFVKNGVSIFSRINKGDEMKELRKITQEELESIIKKHQKTAYCYWGYFSPKVDLSYLDLTGVKFSRLMTSLNLSGSCLDGIDLSNLALSDTDLSYASLRNTILIGAGFNSDLEGTYYRTDFRDADLTGADLSDITLKQFRANTIAFGANLTDVKFKEE